MASHPPRSGWIWWKLSWSSPYKAMTTKVFYLSPGRSCSGSRRWRSPPMTSSMICLLPPSKTIANYMLIRSWTTTSPPTRPRRSITWIFESPRMPSFTKEKGQKEANSNVVSDSNDTSNNRSRNWNSAYGDHSHYNPANRSGWSARYNNGHRVYGRENLSGWP